VQHKERQIFVLIKTLDNGRDPMMSAESEELYNQTPITLTAIISNSLVSKFSKISYFTVHIIP